MIADVLAPLIVSIICQFFLLCSVEHNRKNWLFSDTPEGAQANTLYLTVVEMAKAYGLDLYKYLNFLFEQRPSKDMSDEELEKLVCLALINGPFHLPKFPSAALSSIAVATATTHSSALQAENLSCMKQFVN
ncbi:hypothetical protein [Fusicatenibacter saccharivorans]|uniref:hypothetical protein n=1 Tax=Fusicatenibacter saccharivorans TaxID=1150298 RepID=UPI003F8E7336